MNRITAIFVLTPAMALLVAAGPPPISRADPNFGLTVDANINAMTVDMTPEYAGVPMEGASGRRSADAYRRYQTGNVKKLLSVSGAAAVGGQGGATESVTVTSTPNN